MSHASVGQAFVDLRDSLASVLSLAPTTGETTDVREVALPTLDDEPSVRALRSFDDRIVHPDLIALCRSDFLNEKYTDAARRATQDLSHDVLDKCRAELVAREEAKAAASGRRPGVLKDGTALMQQVFALDDPVLQVPPTMQTQSDQSEQLGYGNLMQGVIGAFRNPRSHDVFFEDDPLVALLIIELVQHLLEVVGTSHLVVKST